MADARQIRPGEYPAYHLAAINAVVTGGNHKFARKQVATCLRRYRARGYHDVARQFLRHIKWIEYPIKRN